MADPQIDLHEALAAAENKARIAYEDWRASSNRDAYVADLARRAARTAVLAAAPFLVQQGRQQAADAILAHAVGLEDWDKGDFETAAEIAAPAVPDGTETGR